MDFGTLKTRVQDVLGRTPNAVAYELVTSDVNNAVRVRSLEKTVSLTSADTIALPADFKSVVSLRFGDVELTPASLQSVVFEQQGAPRRYAISDGTIHLAPRPTTSDDLTLIYLERLADLSADADTNDILTNYPQIYVYGTLFHHHSLTQNAEAAAGYFQLYERAMNEARKENNAALFGTGPVVPKVRSAP